MNKSDIAISPFTIDWYDQVYALWQQCPGVGLGDSDSEEDINMFLERNPGMSLIARVDNTLAGALICGHDGRRGYIHHLAVLPEFRRMGIGRLMIEKCIVALKKVRIPKCHIFIFTDNHLGLKFWDSIGWSYRQDIGIVSTMIDLK